MAQIKAFFDTNIFLNVILEEKDCYACVRLLNRWKCAPDVFCAVTSYLSFANIAYVIRKHVGKDKVAPTLRKLQDYVSYLSDNHEEEYEAAYALKGPDFEDLLQMANARIGGCSAIVTCNKQDFVKITDPSGVFEGLLPSVYTPEEFLAMIGEAGTGDNITKA